MVRDGGNLLFNTSVAQHLGMEGGVIYNSTKGALRTVTRVLAKELAGRTVRVNAVSPGPIGSDPFQRTGMPTDDVQQMARGIEARVLPTSPGRSSPSMAA